MSKDTKDMYLISFLVSGRMEQMGVEIVLFFFFKE